MIEQIEHIAERIEQARGIDRLAEPVQGRIRIALGRAPRLEHVLRGRWLGHPLHAALTDVPVGAWSVALVLDAIELAGSSERTLFFFRRARRQPADAVVAIGLVGSLASAVAGLADWSATDKEAKRAGFVHGIANVAIAGLYTASLVLRRTGARRTAIALSTVGYAALLASAWLGGELTYKLGVGVRRGSAVAHARNTGATSQVEARI